MFGRAMRADHAERTRNLPGDRLVEKPIATITHAITIRRFPHKVWPWLVQMGAGRAGWYSYDFIDNGGHRRRPTAGRRDPSRAGSVRPAGQWRWWRRFRGCCRAARSVPRGAERSGSRAMSASAWRVSRARAHKCRAGGRSKTQAADRRRAGLAHGRPPRRNNTFDPSVLYHGNKDTSPRREPWERNRNPDQPRKGRQKILARPSGEML